MRDILQHWLIMGADASLGKRRGAGGWGEALTLAPCFGEVWAGRDGLGERGGRKHQPNLARSGQGEGGPLLVTVGWRHEQQQHQPVTLTHSLLTNTYRYEAPE